jgi:ribosomal protein S18 acetylase RimI-like enzyme
MAASDPWKALGITYEDAMEFFHDRDKERYVVVSAGELLGFLIIDMSGVLRGYIQDIGVAPSRRGMGIGNMLMDFAEGRIFRDSRNVFLCVSSFNGDAQRFYLKRGFEVVGEIKEFLVRGHSEILMRKSLGPALEFMLPSRMKA